MARASNENSGLLRSVRWCRDSGERKEYVGLVVGINGRGYVTTAVVETQQEVVANGRMAH